MPDSQWKRGINDVEVSVILDCATARELVLDGLMLIDKFYTIF